MRPDMKKQGVIWGGLLIVLGIMMLLETFTDLSAWMWVVALALAGLGVFVLWLATNRENPWKAPWAPLIPAYVLLAIAELVALLELDFLRDPFVAPYVLAVIALPFLVTFLRDRSRWWALIPSYILLAVGGMLLLTEGGLMSDDLVPAYVMFAIAVPFFVVFARDRAKWWALIPGGIMAVIGLSFLIAESAVEYVGAIALVGAGLWIVVRQLGRGGADEEAPAATVEAKAERPAEGPAAE